MIKQPGFSLWSFFAMALCVVSVARGSSFTPLEWQQVVRKHKVALYVGQHKNTTWIRDRNRNFIDDEIEARFHPGDVLNIVVDLNTCLPPEKIKSLFGAYGRIKYVGKLITFVLLDRVRFDDLPKIVGLPDVSMIEWQTPMRLMNDVSTRAVQARKSATYSPNTAEDAGFIGTGV